MKRTTSTRRTLTSLPPLFSSETPTNSLPFLPFDLVAEILCWLPVKFLIQLCCVCKSWNSLISNDSKFAKKHLHLSISNHDRRHIMLSTKKSSRVFYVSDSPISSIFSSVSTTHVKQVSYPLNIVYNLGGVSTCDGILCFGINKSLALLCNPSIRKFNILPSLNNLEQRYVETSYTLVYDRFTDKYKIIALTLCHFHKNEVNIHTIGTDNWRRIQDLPCDYLLQRSGISVSHTVNWLAFDRLKLALFIVSLDLEKESYQVLLEPEFLHDMQIKGFNTLGLLRDCLCILSHSDKFCDVWIMKEYGNGQSWTKLLSVPPIGDRGFFICTKALYISEDDQLLMKFMKNGKICLVIYDSINNTFKIPKIQIIKDWITSEVYIESLISPFSKC